MKTRKPKFRPVISRIKLNPEQAVLSCNCFEFGVAWTTAHLANTPPPPDNICWTEVATKEMLGEGVCEFPPGIYPAGQTPYSAEGQS